MILSFEIWFFLFWRRKWELFVEFFLWSWFEGKDLGLKMSLGKMLLILFCEKVGFL